MRHTHIANRYFLFSCMALSLLAGCVTTSVKSPSMNITGLKMGDPSLTSMPVDVKLKVTNPNPEPLRVERFEYELMLNGKNLGKGYYPDAIVLEPFREKELVSKFEISFLKAPGVLQVLMNQDYLKARVQGVFYVSKGMGLKQLKFDHEAEIIPGK